MRRQRPCRLVAKRNRSNSVCPTVSSNAEYSFSRTSVGSQLPHHVGVPVEDCTTMLFVVVIAVVTCVVADNVVAVAVVAGVGNCLLPKALLQWVYPSHFGTAGRGP